MFDLPNVRAKPWCRVCKAPIERYTLGRNLYRRCYELEAWCHGDYIVREIGDQEIIAGVIWYEVHLFDLPLAAPIIDHDPGDEDPRAHTEVQWQLQ